MGETQDSGKIVVKMSERGKENNGKLENLLSLIKFVLVNTQCYQYMNT